MLNIYGDSSDNSDEENERQPNKKRRIVIYDDARIVYQRFRFYPRQIELLLQVVGPRITPKVRTNNALSANEKLMIGLRFFAANDYYNTLADLQGPSPITICRVIKEVTAAILDGLRDNIGWPADEQGCRRIAADFMRINGIPLVCGAVDGTLISVLVNKDKMNAFRDRYGTTSINMLIVSDAKRRILFASAKFPGATHDARVFRRTIGMRFENNWRPFDGAVLLADSAYAGKDYLVPMRENQEGIRQQFYNSHAKTRVVVEQAIGLLKSRFICLKGKTGRGPLRFKQPEIAASVAMACCHLQNFLFDVRREDENDDDLYDLDEEEAAVPLREDGAEDDFNGTNRIFDLYRQYKGL